MKSCFQALKSSPAVWMSAISLMAVVGGYFFVICPIEQRREALDRQSSEKQFAIARLLQSATPVSDSTTHADAVRKAMADFQLKLPPVGEMDKVLENIWRLAQANSLQTKTVKAPASQTAGAYRQQQMDLTLSGDFGGLYQFMLQLENAKRVLRISHLHLSRVDGHLGQVQAEMTLSVFFEAQKNEEEKI